MDLNTATSKLRQFYRKNKRLPNYSELANLFGYSGRGGAVAYLIKKLESAGIIRRDKSGKLLPHKLNLPLPHFGIIKAGLPIPESDPINESISFDEYLVSKPEKSFVLTVKGDSMIEAGINDGDQVIIEQSQDAKNGEIIAAEIDGEFTLKYFKRTKGKIELIPANSKFKIIVVPENFKVHGKVVGLVRKYGKL